LRRAFREYEEERLRRQAFLHGPIIVNHLKSTDQRKVKVLKQGSMGTGEKDIRNGKVILSPDCLEIMLQNKGETLLERAEDQEEEDEYEESQRERRMQEKEEMELLERIERIRRFLRELKKRDPPHFRELVQSFYDNKKFYGFIMKDIEAKKEDRVLEPLNNDDAY